MISDTRALQRGHPVPNSRLVGGTAARPCSTVHSHRSDNVLGAHLSDTSAPLTNFSHRRPPTTFHIQFTDAKLCLRIVHAECVRVLSKRSTQFPVYVIPSSPSCILPSVGAWWAPKGLCRLTLMQTVGPGSKVLLHLVQPGRPLDCPGAPPRGSLHTARVSDNWQVGKKLQR